MIIYTHVENGLSLNVAVRVVLYRDSSSSKCAHVWVINTLVNIEYVWQGTVHVDRYIYPHAQYPAIFYFDSCNNNYQLVYKLASTYISQQWMRAGATG